MKTITIAVCARSFSPSLARCLDTLDKQEVSPGWILQEFLIVLNEDSSSSDTSIQQLDAWLHGDGSKVDRRIVQEPRQGIPFARNRALEDAKGSWIAFIDDDCVASPEWLRELTRVADRHSAQGVAGSWEIVPDGTPSPWLPTGVWGPKAYNFHGSDSLDGQVIPSAYTRNILFEVPTNGHDGLDLRFDTSLAETGGSDALFFYRFSKSGRKIIFAANACVTEFFDDERLMLRWHLKRRIRNAQTRLRRARETGERRFNTHGGWLSFTVGLIQLPIALLALILFPRNSSLKRAAGWGLLKLAVISGVVMFVVGVEYREYSKAWRSKVLPGRSRIQKK